MLLGIPFTVMFYVKMCGGDKDNNDFIKDKCTNIMSSIIFALFFICFLGAFFAGILSCTGNDEASTTIETITTLLAYGLAAIILLPILIYLYIKHCFGITDKEKRIMYITYSVMIVMLIVVLIITVFDDGIIFIAITLVFFVAHFTNYIWLLRVFWRKRNENNGQNNGNEKDEESGNTGTKDNSDNDENSGLFTRYLVLFCSGFFVELLCFIIIIFWVSFGSDDVGSGLDVDDTALALTALINAICVGLLFDFKFANILYENLCGKCCK